MKIAKTLTSMVIAISAIGIGAQTDTSQPIHVVVDGTAIQFRDQQPAKINNRVLVPLRGIFERLGAHVTWDPTTQTVTGRKDDTVVKLTIGQLDASVDGRDIHLDVPATLVGGSTMVPLRFVSESLGATVTWNDQLQEADITPAPERHEIHRDHPTPPPVVIRPPVQIRRPAPPIVMEVIPPDTVLPLTLNNRLSSSIARPGDPFTATLNTYGQPYYVGLPKGTLVYGTVRYAHPRHGNDPGVIELTFDHLVTPRGQSFPISGRLIGIEDRNVVHGKGGALIARSSERNDRMMFTGYGAGAGLILGLTTKHPVKDMEIGGLLGLAAGSMRKNRPVSDVELVPGTPFGFRLQSPLTVRRGLR